MTSYETLKVEIGTDRVGLITMNRPDALNAMNTAMMRELRDLFMSFYVDEGQAACLVLTGSGTRGFCTGADLKERKGMTDATWRRQHAVVEQMVRAIMDCPIPVIAAVNGHAYAGGMEIALACDFVYAAEHARFALTEVTLGIMPGAAGTQNLPRAVGVRRAKEIILTGNPFSAADALAWGMVNAVHSGGTLLDAAIHRAWIFKLGRLPSHGRVAHFLCETELRLRAVGLSDGARFELPLTQADLAEVCGLTSVHVNRVLRELRERGLVTLRDGNVDVHDGAGLARLGEFDPRYLYLDEAAVPAVGVRPRRSHV